MSPHDLFIVWLSSLAALPVAVSLHELGHVVAGRATGFVVTSFGLGVARPWCVVSLRGVRFFACRSHPLQGVTFAFHPGLYPTRSRQVAFLSGGVLANGASTALGLALCRWLPSGREVWLGFILVSAFFCAASLIPVRFRVGKTPMQSDGASIIQTLRLGTVAQSPPVVIQAVDALRALWTSIGDAVMLRVYLLLASWSCAELRDIERAEQLLGDAESLSEAPSVEVAALAALVRAQVSLARGRPDEAERALDEAEAGYRSPRRPAALFLVALSRAGAYLLKGDAGRAGDILRGLGAEAIATDQPVLAMAWLVARLQAACIGAEDEAVAGLVARYEREARRWHSASRDLQVYATVAEYADRAGDAARAEAAWLAVLEAVGELARDWNDPGQRARFLRLQSGRIDAARAGLRARGRPEPERLARLLDGVPDPTPVEVWSERDRRFRRWGRYGLLGDLAAFVLTMAGGLLTFPQLPNRWLPLAGLFASGIVVWFGYWVLDLTIGRLLPPFRRVGGLVLLILAFYPWLFMALIVLALVAAET